MTPIVNFTLIVNFNEKRIIYVWCNKFSLYNEWFAKAMSYLNSWFRANRLDNLAKSKMVQLDELIEIDRIDLLLLRKLYSLAGPQFYTSYITIDTYIRWFEQDPDLKHIHFFCLNHNISGGTYVVIVSVFKWSCGNDFFSKWTFNVCRINMHTPRMQIHSIRIPMNCFDW